MCMEYACTKKCDILYSIDKRILYKYNIITWYIIELHLCKIIFIFLTCTRDRPSLRIIFECNDSIQTFVVGIKFIWIINNNYEHNTSIIQWPTQKIGLCPTVHTRSPPSSSYIQIATKDKHTILMTYTTALTGWIFFNMIFYYTVRYFT